MVTLPYHNILLVVNNNLFSNKLREIWWHFLFKKMTNVKSPWVDSATHGTLPLVLFTGSIMLHLPFIPSVLTTVASGSGCAGKDRKEEKPLLHFSSSNKPSLRAHSHAHPAHIHTHSTNSLTKKGGDYEGG